MLLNPFNVVRISIFYWHYNDILHWVIVATRIVLINILDEWDNLALWHRDLHSHSVGVRGDPSELQVAAVDSILFKLHVWAETGDEQILYMTYFTVLGGVHGEVGHVQAAGAWALHLIGRLEVRWVLELAGLVSWSHLVPSVGQLVPWVEHWRVETTSVLLTLMPVVLVELVQVAHDISFSVALIVDIEGVGLALLVQRTVLIGDIGLLHSRAD